MLAVREREKERAPGSSACSVQRGEVCNDAFIQCKKVSEVEAEMLLNLYTGPAVWVSKECAICIPNT